MILETHEVLEVAHIAAIMGVEVDFDEWYKKSNNGYVQCTYEIGELALQFYLENKDRSPEYWEEVRDEQGDWDEIVGNYIKNKLLNL